MSDEHASQEQRPEASGDRRLDERSETGEPRPSGPPPGDPTTSSNEAAEQELLCTICGLRACWQ